MIHSSDHTRVCIPSRTAKRAEPLLFVFVVVGVVLILLLLIDVVFFCFFFPSHTEQDRERETESLEAFPVNCVCISIYN